jgi:hypothetical protein
VRLRAEQRRRFNATNTAGSWRVRSRHRDRTADTTGLRQPPTTRNPGGPATLTLTGNGSHTRELSLRATHTAKPSPQSRSPAIAATATPTLSRST